MNSSFFSYQARKFIRYFQTNKTARIFTACLMFLILIGIFWGIYFISKKGLEFTQLEDDIFLNQIGPWYIYEIFLLLTGFLVFLSSTIFVVVNFFKTKRDNWIMASPKYSSLLWVNSLKAINSSAWAIIAISLPLLLAAGKIFSFSILSYFWAILTVVIFSLICSLAAVLFVMLLALLMRLTRLRNIKILKVLVFSAIGFGAVVIWRRVVYMSLEKVFQINNVIDPSLEVFSKYFSVFPSHFPAMVLFNLQEGNIISAFKYLFILILALVFLVFILKLLERKFLYIWQIFQEGSFEAKKEGKRRSWHVLKNSFPKTSQGVIYRKEILTSLRSSKNFLWFVFLATLLFAQVGVITLLDKYSSIGDGFVVSSGLIILQQSIVLFFITAFIVRFVFPSFSQEGKTSWIIASAPIKMSKIFLSKYKLFSLILVILGILSIFLYIIPLQLSFLLALILVAVIIVAILTLTMLGLALGVVYINFESNDPNELSTSAGGMIFMVSALAYIALTAYLLYLSLGNANYLFLVLYLLISLFLSIVLGRRALKSLDKLEFYL